MLTHFLDGGGTRGISILLILKSLLSHVLEQENKKRQKKLKELPKVCEMFDLIGGTNAGG